MPGPILVPKALSADDQLQTFDYGGGTLVDEIGGQGSDQHIVFLHGWGSNRESLRGVATLFENLYLVHLLDLPGFGDAPVPPDDWDTTKYADLVEQYLRCELSGSVTLVGHSFGGRVALRLAARRVPAVRALVLMAVPGLPLPRWSRRRLRASAIRGLRRTLTLIRPMLGAGPINWHTRTFGSKDYLSAGKMRSVFIRAVNEDLTDTARAVACPTLLLWGAEDGETPVWLATRFRRLIAGPTTLEILPHKDHYLYTSTGAHLCAFKIRQWLDGHVDR